MTVMTLLSRVLGLVREQVRAFLLGTGAASDAFGLAAVIPNLMRRLLAEGAMTAAFIPVFTDYLKRGDEEDTRAFLSRFFTLLTLVTTGVCLLGALLTPWLVETFFASRFQEVEGKVELTVILTRLMWPYLLFVTIAALVQAILNTHKIFGPSAFTPVLLNLAIIGCGLGLAQLMPDPSYGLVIGFIVGGVLQMAFQVPYLFRGTSTRFSIDLRLNDPGVRKVLWIMIPGVLAAGIYQVNVFVSQLIASTLDGGSIASLQFSVRLQELVLGLFVVSVSQVILPTLAAQTTDEDMDGVRDTLAYATRLMLFVTLPSTAALIVLGEPIVRLLFETGAFDEDSTAMTVFALQFHALGLLPIALARVQQQVFFAAKDLKTPTKVAAVVAVVNIVGCVVLSRTSLEHGGIALAGSLAAVVNTGAFIVLLKGRLGDLSGRQLLSRAARLVLATSAMVGALEGLAWLWAAPDDRLVLVLWVGAAVVVGAVTYIAAAALLRANEFGQLVAAVRRRSLT